MLGKEIETLVDEEQHSGLHEVTFSMENLAKGFHLKTGYASGIYICRLSAGGYFAAKKLVLLK